MKGKVSAYASGGGDVEGGAFQMTPPAKPMPLSEASLIDPSNDHV